MPGTSGLVATRRILEKRGDVAILMLSMHSEQTLVSQALEAGARGYILKNALDLDLASAVKRVAAGEIVLDPTVTPSVALKGERNHGLTPRELEVLQLICQGIPIAPLPIGSTSASIRSACIAPTSWARSACTRPPSSWSTRCSTDWSDPCESPRVPSPAPVPGLRR